VYLLLEYESLHYHELLLVHRQHELAVFLPGSEPLGDHLAYRHVLDLDLLVKGLYLQPTRNLVDFRVEDHLARFD